MPAIWRRGTGSRARHRDEQDQRRLDDRGEDAGLPDREHREDAAHDIHPAKTMVSYLPEPASKAKPTATPSPPAAPRPTREHRGLRERERWSAGTADRRALS